MSSGTGSRAAGVVAALAILLLGTLLYQLWGPASDPTAPEPATPALTVVEPAPPARETAPPPPVIEAGEIDTAEPERGVREQLRELASGGGALTEGVMELPVMGELPADDERYDPAVEAQQIFHPFEQTLLQADPLDPDSWRAAQEQHALRNERSWRRADFLRRSGYTEEASDLMLEWSRLNGIWQARAYGRPHRPGGEDGE